MVYALIWFLVVALLALWSLAAWALHAVAVWTVSNAGALTGAAAGAEGIVVPAWLAPWMPPEVAQWATRMTSGLAPFIDSLLQAAPALAAGFSVATWVIWGIGSVLLVMLGAGLHLLSALWRRRRSRESGPHAGRSLAAG